MEAMWQLIVHGKFPLGLVLDGRACHFKRVY